MIQLLRFGNHSHPSADLVVEDDLGDCFGVFYGELLKDWVALVVDLVPEGLLLVLAPATEGAVGD